MSKTYKKWSTEEDLVISRMRKEGSTTKVIASFLNRSERSVANRIQRLINCCQVEKIKKATRGRINVGFCQTLPKPKRSEQPKVKKFGRGKIDYDEVARRIENGGIRNIQKTLRAYASEVGVSITTLHKAYYSESQAQTRIKDRVRLYTVISPTCMLEGANKNTDKPVVKVSIWKKLKSLLSSLLYS